MAKIYFSLLETSTSGKELKCKQHDQHNFRTNQENDWNANNMTNTTWGQIKKMIEVQTTWQTQLDRRVIKCEPSHLEVNGHFNKIEWDYMHWKGKHAQRKWDGECFYNMSMA